MHRFGDGQSSFELASAPLSNRRPWFAQAFAPLEMRCRIRKCFHLCWHGFTSIKISFNRVYNQYRGVGNQSAPIGIEMRPAGSEWLGWQCDRTG
jgi:hypothetical protein